MNYCVALRRSGEPTFLPTLVTIELTAMASPSLSTDSPHLRRPWAVTVSNIGEKQKRSKVR